MKRRYVLTFFAVFTATLMLMTTCIAGPTKEKTTLEIIEEKQESLYDSLNDLVLAMENDDQILALSDILSNNRELNRISYEIENAESFSEKNKLANQYYDVLSSKSEFDDLQSYINSEYSSDMQDINEKYAEIASLMAEYMTSETDESSSNLEAALPLAGAIYSADQGTSILQTPTMQTIESVNGMEYQDWYIPSDDGDDSTDGGIDSSEGHWAGFLRNLDGDILTPDGWISPEDPYYDDWLIIEDFLRTLPVGYATELLDEIVAIFNDYGPTGPIWDLIIEIIEEIIRIINDVIDNIVTFIEDIISNILAGIIAVLIIVALLIFDEIWKIYTITVAILSAILEFLEDITP